MSTGKVSLHRGERWQNKGLKWNIDSRGKRSKRERIEERGSQKVRVGYRSKILG